MAELDAITDRVGRELLRAFGKAERTEHGFLVSLPKTELIVDMYEFGEPDPEKSAPDAPRVHMMFTAVMLLDCPVTDELCRWIATEAHQSYFFDGPRAYIHDEKQPDLCDLVLQHRLLGDTADPVEIRTTANFLVFSAVNNLDSLQQRFGGRLVTDSGDKK